MPITEPAIYKLKVVLQGISPMIWRRLLIRDDTTIADLHYILQIASVKKPGDLSRSKVPIYSPLKLVF